MTHIGRWTLVVAVGMLLATGAFAVAPAYVGPMGNQEEPALRPYKWILRGLKACVFQTVSAVERGNQKTPAVGTLEGFRGVRRGTVEVAQSYFKGAMLFSPPPKAGDYKKLSSANEFIDNDLFFRNVCDYIVASQFLVWADARDAWKWGLLLWGLQKELDHYPAVNPVEQEKAADKVQLARAKKKAEAKPMTRKQAQNAYIGDRIPSNRKDPYKGDIRDLVR